MRMALDSGPSPRFDEVWGCEGLDWSSLFMYGWASTEKRKTICGAKLRYQEAEDKRAPRVSTSFMRDKNKATHALV